jgi:hypothetical protein
MSSSDAATDESRSALAPLDVILVDSPFSALSVISYPRYLLKLTAAGYKCWMDLASELQGNILGLLSLITVVTLGCTSRYNHLLVQGHIRDRVYYWLMAFGLPPELTLAQMKELHGIISGSVALALIEPWIFKPQDIDMYFPAGCLEQFESFLISLGVFEEDAKPNRDKRYQRRGGRKTGAIHSSVTHRILITEKVSHMSNTTSMSKPVQLSTSLRH